MLQTKREEQETYIYALDFAKLGYLVLAKGKWGKKQIINPDYAYRLIN